MDFYIKQENKDRCTITSVEKQTPVTVDMTLEEATDFLAKMMRIKANSLQPDTPRLYYNRAED
jgi:hypothetical protein